MRGFKEVKGQNIRLVYDRERAKFLVKIEPHLFLVHESATEVDVKHGYSAEPEGRRKC